LGLCALPQLNTKGFRACVGRRAWAGGTPFELLQLFGELQTAPSSLAILLSTPKHSSSGFGPNRHLMVKKSFSPDKQITATGELEEVLYFKGSPSLLE
ncbi:MAG: hypothetical protein ACYCOU_22715, partial [Sulfobacillus sp.]